MQRISATRRLVQALSFIVIVYGGFVFAPQMAPQEIIAGTGYRGSFERGHGVRWVEREKVSVPFHLPVTSCYYQHKGLFSGCVLLFLSEHLAELSPLWYVLPELLLIIFLMFVFGRMLCGWVCPFGLLSDILTWLRELCGLDHLRLSRPVRAGLVVTKYVLLAATLGLSLLAAVPSMSSHKLSLFLPFCQVCMGKWASPLLSSVTVCWINFRDWITSSLSLLGLTTMVLFFAGFFVRRLYCRICPVGGCSALFNRYGLVSLYKDARRCTRCQACARVCPVDNLTVFEGRVSGPVDACECTLCLRCVEACPEPGCLELTVVGKTVVKSA